MRPDGGAKRGVQRALERRRMRLAGRFLPGAVVRVRRVASAARRSPPQLAFRSRASPAAGCRHAAERASCHDVAPWRAGA
ncbi:hypothetical protein QS306_15665 [Paraburkholderia bonniea]|uniref:hypothetical protein n=1 Tax=Paraburkholderia bonniea TaxID=2152891 RepID=UPI002573E501|nr:hypothetical protein [Paraburkholderia bonniea]WJF91526.1 hypothetical protein QS306_15665 [Paraburkholderia bonniea]WJF94845.1 hypothetical protein QS308_15670 [Paraburkholderia bonniea]